MLLKLAPHLVGPAALLAAGLGWQALLPRPLERSCAARWGFGYLLGAAWVALAGWALGHVAGARLSGTLFVALAAAPVLLGGAARVLRRRRPAAAGSRSPRVRRRHAWAAWTAGAFGAAVSLALLADAVTDPVRDFDGRMTWGTAARYLAAEGRTTPAAFADETAFVVHPRYPIGLPILRVAAVELSSRGFASFSERPLYALFLPALLLTVWPALVRAYGRRASLLALLLVGSAPVLLWGFDSGPRSTYSDFPLAAFLGGAVAAWLHPGTRREPWRGAVAGLLLAGVAASKNEGLVLAPLAVVAFAAVARRGWRPSVAALGPVLAACALVVHWRSGIPNRNDEAYFENLSGNALLEGLLVRAPRLLGRGLERLLDADLWGALFWWLLPGLLLLVAARRSRATRLALGLVAVETLLVGSAYSVAPADVLEATWDRFVLQQAASWAVLVAAVAREALSGAVSVRRAGSGPTLGAAFPSDSLR